MVETVDLEETAPDLLVDISIYTKLREPEFEAVFSHTQSSKKRLLANHADLAMMTALAQFSIKRRVFEGDVTKLVKNARIKPPRNWIKSLGYGKPSITEILMSLLRGNPNFSSGSILPRNGFSDVTVSYVPIVSAKYHDNSLSLDKHLFRGVIFDRRSLALSNKKNPNFVSILDQSISFEDGSIKISNGQKWMGGIATVGAVAAVYASLIPYLEQREFDQTEQARIELILEDSQCRSELNMTIDLKALRAKARTFVDYNEHGITPAEKRVRTCNLQLLLAMQSYDVRAIDGWPGENTEGALRDFYEEALKNPDADLDTANPVFVDLIFLKSKMNRE